MRTKKFLFLIFILCVGADCKKSNSTASPIIITPPPAPVTTFFAKGADVSWLTQMEASGL